MKYNYIVLAEGSGSRNVPTSNETEIRGNDPRPIPAPKPPQPR